MRYIAIFVCMLLSGCLSKGDIFNHQTLAGSSITTMDARQRSILANIAKGINTNDTFLRMCAEPFPDIFTVVSSSLSAGLEAEASADQGKIASAKVGAQIAQALKESGASIDRSQTVNLLNMSLYRTCERYMNGIIDEKELKIQAFRDQQAMVSILAIEQLTNLARPAPTKIILDSGFAEANANIASSNQSLKNTLLKATEEYEKALKLKEEKLKNSKQKDKCDFEDATQQKECDDAALKLSDSSQAFIQAQMQYNKALVTTTNAGAQVGNAQSSNIVINDNRKPDANIDYNTVKHIADTVLELAKLGTKFDCNQYLAINEPSSQSFRKCDGTDKSDGEDVAIDKSDKAATLKAKECNLKDSEIKFYVQAKRNCDECEKKAEEAKVALNTILHKRCERLVSYPIDFIDKNSMPNNNEIRYFNDDDKSAAEEIAAKLGVKIKKFNIKSSPHVIEYWVGKNS